jgi:Protein of unknown function (DUF3465)
MPRNKLFIIAALALAAGTAQWLQQERGLVDGDDAIEQSASPTQASPGTSVDRAFAARTSNVQVEGEGVVSKLLKDDNDGSRHQRFILTLSSGRTLLVAHNIDLAPRLDALREGDTVRFFGEYEWNTKGGVLHWTHHDPNGRHVGGWLEHQGRRYE